MADREAGDAWVARVLGLRVDRAPTEESLSGESLSATWRDARDLAGEQIGRLQSSMRSTRHPLLVRIADKGLNAFSGRLQVGLQAALLDYERAPEANRERLREAVADMRRLVERHPAITLLEGNPMGVSVTLRATLGGALDRIDAQLG